MIDLPPGWELLSQPGCVPGINDDVPVRLRRRGSDDTEGVSLEEAWRIYEREEAVQSTRPVL